MHVKMIERLEHDENPCIVASVIARVIDLHIFRLGKRKANFASSTPQYVEPVACDIISRIPQKDCHLGRAAERTCIWFHCDVIPSLFS